MDDDKSFAQLYLALYSTYGEFNSIANEAYLRTVTAIKEFSLDLKEFSLVTNFQVYLKKKMKKPKSI